MKTYVWLSFAFLGWGYYEMSGGSDFEPEIYAAANTQTTAPEIVTRADTTTLLAMSSSNVAPSVTSQIEPVAVAQPALQAPEIAPEIIAVVAPVVEPKLDIREVTGTRVNMRMGPGTGFDVITTLDGGTKLEVLDVNAAGWANVSTERGLEGWMAARLLTDPET